MSTPEPTSSPSSSPSEERLIGYLIAGEAASGNEPSDAAIEQWLAADVANVQRLEALATTVLAVAWRQPADAVASGEPWTTVALSAAEEAPRGESGGTAASGGSRPAPVRAAALGLLALAATLALAIFWPQTPPTAQWSTQRVALAWAENDAAGASAASPTATDLESAGGALEEIWASDWELANSEDWVASGDSESFAANNDAPPQWLVTAVAQISSAADLQTPEFETMP